MTIEDAHSPNATDPSNCVRNQTGKGLRQLLLDGELAAIMGERDGRSGRRPAVIPDAEQAAHAWIERTGIQPINHTMAVKTDLVSEHPWLAGELMRDVRRGEATGRVGRCRGAAALRARGQPCVAADVPSISPPTQKLTPRVYRADECFIRSELAHEASGGRAMIIDIHGHYTTEPQALQLFRDKQLAGLADVSRRRRPRRTSASPTRCSTSRSSRS